MHPIFQSVLHPGVPNYVVRLRPQIPQPVRPPKFKRNQMVHLAADIFLRQTPISRISLMFHRRGNLPHNLRISRRANIPNRDSQRLARRKTRIGKRPRTDLGSAAPNQTDHTKYQIGLRQTPRIAVQSAFICVDRRPYSCPVTPAAIRPRKRCYKTRREPSVCRYPPDWKER
ncbi:MAG: hypothetical protein JWO80_6484 [Bryobacterales bacterium]|nr:hypothetical protein [Bryobacterales bacterium]